MIKLFFFFAFFVFCFNFIQKNKIIIIIIIIYLLHNKKSLFNKKFDCFIFHSNKLLLLFQAEQLLSGI